MTDTIGRLIATIGAYYDEIGAPAWAVAPTRDLPPPSPYERSGSVAADRHLAAVLAAAPAAMTAVAAAIARATSDLAWHYGYPARPGHADLSDRVAFCELLGPRAAFRSSEARLGLTLIGPATHYPAHVHPAVELYHVLAGEALWTADGATRAVPPGQFVLHPSGVSHAMETSDAGLLAIYSWTGDVISPSVYVD